MLRKETPRKAGCGGQVPVVRGDWRGDKPALPAREFGDSQGPENKIRTHADNESGPQSLHKADAFETEAETPW
jgi:hypothetical protein